MSILSLFRAAMKPKTLVLLWQLRGLIMRRTRAYFFSGSILSIPGRLLSFPGKAKRAVARLSRDDRGRATIHFLTVKRALKRALKLGDCTGIEQSLNALITCDIPLSIKRQLPLIRYAIAKAKQGDGQSAIKELDELYSDMGCQLVRIDPRPGREVFDSFVGIKNERYHSTIDYPPLRDGPLVSIIMTTFNSETFVRTAVMSIMNQSYRNLELIVVDDHSSDGTVDILLELENKHDRIHVICKDSNDGTYVSKNLGILGASGNYLAFQDSDDWSHPDRIGKSIAVLESQPHLVALTTELVRMTTNGDIIVHSSLSLRSLYTYKCCPSLVFRLKEVISRAGYFDSVIVGGDNEYIKRIRILFGDKKVVNFPWLLNFGLVRSDSLTANPIFEIIQGRSRPAREAYQKAYREWHEKIRKTGENGYMPFPMRERPFKAPKEILPKGGRDT